MWPQTLLLSLKTRGQIACHNKLTDGRNQQMAEQSQQCLSWITNNGILKMNNGKLHPQSCSSTPAGERIASKLTNVEL